MKKLTALLIVFLLLFSFNIYAQEKAVLSVEESSLEGLSLSAEKGFSQSAREELLGIASQFNSREAQELDQLTFDSKNFSISESNTTNKQTMSLLQDLSLGADYSQREDKKLETAADFQLEYALNSRTLIRAGYSLLNEEWWDIRGNSSEINDSSKPDESGASKLSPGEDASASSDQLRKVYQNEIEQSRSLGVAYKTSDRVTLSADFIDNNEFGSYYDEDNDIIGESTVFGLEYSYPEGSSIRARYQVDTADDTIQKITGVDFAFNNLATFSASYKLLDPKELKDASINQKTAWDLGVGVNINDVYGLSLGYELIEDEREEEKEKKIKASFEINF